MLNIFGGTGISRLTARAWPDMASQNSAFPHRVGAHIRCAKAISERNQPFVSRLEGSPKVRVINSWKGGTVMARSPDIKWFVAQSTLATLLILAWVYIRA